MGECDASYPESHVPEAQILKDALKYGSAANSERSRTVRHVGITCTPCQPEAFHSLCRSCRDMSSPLLGHLAHALRLSTTTRLEQ